MADEVKSVASASVRQINDPTRLFERLPYVPHGPELSTVGLKFANQNAAIQISPHELDRVNAATRVNCDDLVEYVLNPTVGAVKALSAEITTGSCPTLIRLFAVPEVYGLFTAARYFDLAVPLITASMSAAPLVPFEDRLRNLQQVFSRLGIKVLQFELFLLLFMSSQSENSFINETWKMVPPSTHSLLWKVMFNPNDINTKTRNAMLAAHVCDQLVSLGSLQHHSWLKLHALSYVHNQVGRKSPVSSQRAKEWLLDRFQPTPHSTAPVYLNVDSLIAKRAASDAIVVDELMRIADNDPVAIQEINRMPVAEKLHDNALQVVTNDIGLPTVESVRTQKLKETSRHVRHRARNRAVREEAVERFE
jgi:hypothetical protein